jgi:N-methylhydantoinase A
MLGILSTEEGFAGGSFSLNQAGVAEAFAHIGAQMGYSAEDAAHDCWRVVNANMSQGVRRITAGQGIDPKDMVMLAYGGNGPVFAAIQAEDLGIDRVLIPKASPSFSALGTLVANPTIDEEYSYFASADALDLDRLRALWGKLGERASGYFIDASIAASAVATRYQMNMRYPGQNFALTFDIHTSTGFGDLDFIDADIGATAIALFNRRHMEEYGHIREEEKPEITGVRLASSFQTPSPVVGKGFTAPLVAAIAASTRRANLGQGFQSIDIFRGASLTPGHAITGPAIIEESFTTIVVYAGWRVQVDDAGDYEMTRIDPGDRS